MNKKLKAKHSRFTPQKPWKYFWFFREYHLLLPFQSRISNPFWLLFVSASQTIWKYWLHHTNSGNFTTVWQ